MKLENILKKYPDAIALNSVDLEFDFSISKIIGIFGENGSGKSTLVKIIANQINYSAGNILYDSINIDEIRLVSALTSFLPTYTGIENLEYFLDKSSTEIYSELERINKNFYEDFINKKYKSYSTGMKQRLAILFAILENKKLIIFDEPTIGLDVLSIERLKDVIMGSNSKFLIISHDMDFLGKLTSQIYVLNRGNLKAILSLDDIQIRKKYHLSFSNKIDMNIRSILTKYEIVKDSEFEIDLLLNNGQSITHVIDSLHKKGLTEVYEIKQTLLELLKNEVNLDEK